MKRSVPALILALCLVLTFACSEKPPAEESRDSGAQAAPTASATPNETTAPPDATPAVAGGALNVDEEGRAARGFDVVAYHREGQAVAGDPAFHHTWKGVEWLFKNAENRDAFAADPASFAPSNGGYCTFGIVLKKKLDVDPEVFLVEDERLYLFLNREVQEKFLTDKEGNLQLVSAHWPEIADKHPDELVGTGG